METICIGLGGAGNNICSHWMKSTGGNGYILDLDESYITHPTRLTGLDELFSLFNSKTQYVIVGGLGGSNTDSYLIRIIDYLDLKGCSYKIGVFLPFAFEGSHRNRLALKLHEKLTYNSNYNFIDLKSKHAKYADKKMAQFFNLVEVDLFTMLNR